MAVTISFRPGVMGHDSTLGLLPLVYKSLGSASQYCRTVETIDDTFRDAAPTTLPLDVSQPSCGCE